MGNDYKPWENVDTQSAAKIIGEWDDLTHQELPKSIGRIIISWSQLELTIQTFLRELTDMRPDYFLASIGQLDIYQKINSLHAIAGASSPDEKWLKHLTELRNYICGTLRGERNRIAHDMWSSEKDGPHSIEFKTRFDGSMKRPNYFNHRDRSTDDLDQLCAKIVVCCGLVKRLRDIYFQGKPAPSQQTHQEE